MRLTCKCKKYQRENCLSDLRNDAADRLGNEPVGRLLFRFSLPAITGMLVNALYNLVDRIFVGRGVNESALAGLSLVLPLITVALAFAMLFGIGSANMISMRLGQGRRQEAENTLTNCLFLLAGVGIVLTTGGLIFIDEILSLMGAQEGSLALDYARRYFRIILYGTVVFLVGFGFSNCTRAQGFPIITMIGMLLGAGLNIVLSALFVFVFHWGIEGAAWATVVSQAVSCVWILSFSLSKKAVVRLRLAGARPSLKIAREIMMFGSAQFFMQFVMSAVQLLYNVSIGWHGADSLGVADGGDIALSGISIINAIMMIIIMPVIGITQGAQPILGYNYGAKNYDRVLKTYIRAVTAATCICMAGFIIVQSFPLALVRAFVPDGSEALYLFTPAAMRIIMLLLPLTGFQLVSAHFFAVTGRPKVAILLNLLRQCIILIPCIVIFGRLWGLTGIMAAAPVADAFSVLFTAAMIAGELRKLKRLSSLSHTAPRNTP